MAFDQLGPSRVCSADQVGLFHDQHWTLRSIAGTVAGTTNATILIDATGRRRAVARAIGIGSISADRLVAWHGAIGTSASPPLTLEIKAAPDGWWYGCGGNERQAVLCFLTDGGRASQTLAEKLIARPEAETLARHFFARPSDWTPKPYPAGTSWLAEPAGADWLAIGDAALALDPLSGQGLEFAIASAVRGAAAAAAALRGEKSAIALYAAMVEQRRRWMLRARTDVYRLNRRWPHEEFWRRRQGVEPIAA
jgi:flavin-dependent dehydrogenase